MQTRELIVDGNNLLHAWKPRAELSRDFPAARQALARMLDDVAGIMGADLLLVFDGTRGGRDEGLSSEGVEVLYATPETPADTVIERRVRDAAQPEALLVVSSDRGVQRTCAAAGAEVTTCEQFLATCSDLAKSGRERTRFRATRKPGPTLGDFFPPDGGNR